MKLFASDGRLLERGGRVRLVKLDDRWHVAGDGYLCMVNDYEEGLTLMESLQAEAQQKGNQITREQDLADPSACRSRPVRGDGDPGAPTMVRLPSPAE